MKALRIIIISAKAKAPDMVYVNFHWLASSTDVFSRLTTIPMASGHPPNTHTKDKSMLSAGVPPWVLKVARRSFAIHSIQTWQRSMFLNYINCARLKIYRGVQLQEGMKNVGNVHASQLALFIPALADELKAIAEE
jgi:hypothetical protein